MATELVSSFELCPGDRVRIDGRWATVASVRRGLLYDVADFFDRDMRVTFASGRVVTRMVAL